MGASKGFSKDQGLEVLFSSPHFYFCTIKGSAQVLEVGNQSLHHLWMENFSCISDLVLGTNK